LTGRLLAPIRRTGLTDAPARGVLGWKRRLAARAGRYAMAWTKPVITETPCGAEINLYVSAEI
jgi:coenzyme PQQ precursor peptide PqqA